MAKPAKPEPVQLQFDDELECVIADTLKFRRKLRIGENAYALLRAKNGLQSLWDVGGVVTTAGSIAASPLIAGAFFGSSAGWLSVIGIGAAATPIGWVITAAVATGGAYYGVTRLVKKQADDMVDTIPRFINTPIDLLGMQLLDLMGSLAVRVAAIDGKITASERKAIERHFIDEWGYAPGYVKPALRLLTADAGAASIKPIAKSLAEFQAANPDCNGAEMQKELMEFLRDVVAADGNLDEREELALDAIQATFAKENAVSLSKLSRPVSRLGESVATAVDGVRRLAGRGSPASTKT